MTESFHARVMALPYRESGYSLYQLLEIAAEADALREAAVGLRVALKQARADLGSHYMMAPTTVGPALTRVDTALAAFDKATGEQP